MILPRSPFFSHSCYPQSYVVRILKDREKELEKQIALLEKYVSYPTAHTPSEWVSPFFIHSMCVLGLQLSALVDARCGATLLLFCCF